MVMVSDGDRLKQGIFNFGKPANFYCVHDDVDLVQAVLVCQIKVFIVQCRYVQ